MPNPGLCKDVSKRTTDLTAKKKFPADIKFASKTKTSNGVIFEAEVSQDAKKNMKGFIKPKYNWTQLGKVEVSGEFTLDRAIKSEVSFQDEIVQGLKVTLGGQANKKDLFGTVATEYKHDQFTATASVDYGKDNGSEVQGSLLVGHNGFVLGGMGTFVAFGKPNQTLSCDLSAGYKCKEFDAVLFSKYKQDAPKEGQPAGSNNTLGFAYYQDFTPEIAVGGEYSIDVKKTDKQKLLVGTQWKVHPESTFKGTFDTDGVLYFSYQQKLNSNLKTTIGATVNVKDNSQTSFGATLNLE